MLMMPPPEKRRVVDELREKMGVDLRRTQLGGLFPAGLDIKTRSDRTTNQYRNITSLTDVQNSSKILIAKKDWERKSREAGLPLSYVDLLMSDNFKKIAMKSNTNMKQRKKFRQEHDPEDYAELEESQDYILGNLSPTVYGELKDMFSQKHLDNNNFGRLINEARKKTENAPSKVQENEKLAEALIDFMGYREAMNYKRGVNKGKVKTREDTIEIFPLPQKHAQIFEEDVMQIFGFNTRDIRKDLQNPTLTDEDLEKLLITAEGRLTPKIVYLFRDFYNQSEAHLSEGGLSTLIDEQQRQLKDIKTTDDFMEWYKDISKQIGTPKIDKISLEAIKDKIPPQMYKTIKETLENYEDVKLPEDITNYLTDIAKGWSAFKIEEEGPLWERIKKLYRKRTPKYKVRFEAWFKAARIEFGGGSSKNYPVLMELAGRIAQNNYKDLFEIDTEIKVWYQNWGNDDDRIVELIERLEANTGEMADWSLAEKRPPNAVKDAFQKEMVEQWIGEQYRELRGLGFGEEELISRITKELKGAEVGNEIIEFAEFYIRGRFINDKDLGFEKDDVERTVKYSKKIK